MKKKKIFMLMLCGMAAISVLAAPAKKTGLSSDAEKEAQNIAAGKAKAADAKHKANEAQRRVADKANNAKRKDLSYGSEPFSDIAEGFTKVIENSAEGETEAADPYAGKVDHVEVKKLKEDAQKESEEGAKAQYELGLCYEKGKLGVKTDLAQAAKYYQKAAKSNPDAMYRLGLFYMYGVGGIKQSYSQAVSWYKKAAEKDHDNAWNNLGVCYKQGKGIKQDSEKAVECFKKAATKGNIYAQYNLGCYYLSEYRDVMYKKFFEKMRKLKNKNEDEEYAKLNDDIKEKANEGFSLLLEAAAKEHPAATREVAWCYWYNLVKPDNDKEAENPKGVAEEWFLKAAKYGDVFSRRFLAELYLEQKKLDEALELINKMVEKEDSWGETMLGMCHEQGVGVDKDPEKAVEYYQKAADKKYPKAMGYLGHCYYNGIGVKQDYNKGHGTKKDLKKAEQYLRIAGDSGLAYAETQNTEKKVLSQAEKLRMAETGLWLSVASQLKLADIYYKSRNYYAAAMFYPAEAEKGNETAQFNLAYSLAAIYSDAEALKWYNGLIKKGRKCKYYVVSLNNVGVLYRRGCGVKRDYSKAVNYFREASRLGNSEADVNLAIAHLYGQGVRRDPYWAVQRLTRAARKKNYEAMHYLSLCYYDGVGVGKNKHEYERWIYRAASGGFSRSMSWIESQAASGNAQAQKFLNSRGGYNEKGDADF